MGGGVIVQGVVVTQPSSGAFRGFSPTCPHAGCSCNSIAGGTITCPCHGSQFAIADGHVTRGPARNGLATIGVKVVDGWVCRA